MYLVRSHCVCLSRLAALNTATNPHFYVKNNFKNFFHNLILNTTSRNHTIVALLQPHDRLPERDTRKGWRDVDRSSLRICFLINNLKMAATTTTNFIPYSTNSSRGAKLYCLD